MSQSPFSRSIWTGLSDGFKKLGCDVQLIDATELPNPGSLKFLPDLLLCIHGRTAATNRVEQYRTSGVPTAVYLLDEPYEVDLSTQWARYYDWVFSVDKITLPIHAEFSEARHLPLGYNNVVFNENGSHFESDILVLGSPFGIREELLSPVRDRWAERITWVGPTGWRAFSPKGQHIEQVVTPEQCAQLYRGTKISINIHRDSTWSHFGDLNNQNLQATHLNPRFWETSACASFQLNSYRSDIEFFAPGATYFSDIDQLVERIAYYIEHDDNRKKQAALMHNAVKKHHYGYRAKQILNYVGVTIETDPPNE